MSVCGAGEIEKGVFVIANETGVALGATAVGNEHAKITSIKPNANMDLRLIVFIGFPF
jgi:hypothetical protein